jgi:Tfp pilus assembly protein FimT
MMKMRKFNSQSGASLVEILIVLVITVILATFAIAQLGQSKTNLQRQNVARELKINLERARFDSVKRRAANAADMARVTIDSATSFSVSTDLNQNGTIDASDTRQINFGSGDARIVGIGTFPVTISFDRRGHIIVTNGSPNFTVCNACTTTNPATAQNSNTIWISPTGTVSMTAGGETQPTFAPPANLTSVTNTANINPKVSISQSNYNYSY